MAAQHGGRQGPDEVELVLGDAPELPVVQAKVTDHQLLPA
jgi:hypothetical protein